MENSMMIDNVSSSIERGREVSVLVTGKNSLTKIMKRIESDGYQVTDVLPRLRALIVYLTPEQLNDIEEMGEDVWTTTVMDKWKGNLFN